MKSTLIFYRQYLDMQLINKLDKGFTFSLRVIDIFSKYA